MEKERGQLGKTTGTNSALTPRSCAVTYQRVEEEESQAHAGRSRGRPRRSAADARSTGQDAGSSAHMEVESGTKTYRTDSDLPGLRTS